MPGLRLSEDEVLRKPTRFVLSHYAMHLMAEEIREKEMEAQMAQLKSKSNGS